MAVSVLIPWSGDCPSRLKARERVVANFEQDHPSWSIIVGECSGPWVKARAVSDALSRTDGDILVVSDADVWCDGTGEAVDVVRSGLAAWAIPHFLVRRLGPDGEPCERPYRGVMGGGIVVTTREVIRQTPLDPRFVGWG